MFKLRKRLTKPLTLQSKSNNFSFFLLFFGFFFFVIFFFSFVSVRSAIDNFAEMSSVLPQFAFTSLSAALIFIFSLLFLTTYPARDAKCDQVDFSVDVI